jgi:thiamine transport system ATP-binding protein
MRLSHAEESAVLDALSHVGLSGMQSRRPAELSGGQRGRVALARVLVQNRPLVLLDEPFAALGPALRREMLGLVRDLARETGATLLMVTHLPDDIRQIADQAILVAEGKVHRSVPARELLNNPPPEMRSYLG